MVKRNRKRKETDWLIACKWPHDEYKKRSSIVDETTKLQNLNRWIDKNTTGRFYLSARQIAFEDEKEFVIYKMGFGRNG